jgi:hypothetical protein
MVGKTCSVQPCGGEFYVTKTGGADALNSFFNGIPVITIGIYRNDMLHADTP